MSYISDDNYYVVQGWMLNRLKLSGLDLLVYAIIYGFAQKTDSGYFGSLQYLADFTGSSKNGIAKAIERLKEKKLIAAKGKSKNGCVIYVIASTGAEQKEKQDTTECVSAVQLSSTPYTTECDSAVQLSVINNINNNITDNIKDKREERARDATAAKSETAEVAEIAGIIETPEFEQAEKPEKPKRFKKPTIGEIESYMTDNALEMDAREFFDYYEANGWHVGRVKMVSWRNAASNWARREKTFSKNKSRYKEPPRIQADVYDGDGTDW